MIDQAKREEGYAYYLFPDPSAGMTEKLMLSYVRKVDDDWWLGAGVYGASANASYAASGTYLGEIVSKNPPK